MAETIGQPVISARPHVLPHRETKRAVALSWLQQPVSIIPLVVFRVMFGVLMFVSTLRFMLNGWVTAFYITPSFHFTYLGFSWVRPVSEAGMYLVFILMLLFSVFIALGIRYRLSMIAFFVLFSYVELLDKAYYLNHYYFISLLSFLLIFLPLHRFGSVDAWRTSSLQTRFIPRWIVLAIRLQLCIVYFFAGLAKLSPDWLLQAEPLRIWLPSHANFPLIGSLFLTTWFPFVMSWLGAAYDLTIPFWLSWRRTRFVAYLVVIGFHVMTALLFPIGMFPWMMIATTVIFFDESDYGAIYGVIRCIIGWLPKWQVAEPQDSKKQNSPINRYLVLVLGLFFVAQMALPLRHYLYAGDPNWTQDGFRFAWRVMLVESVGYVTFNVHDANTDKRWEVLPSTYLNSTQERQMAVQPDMIHEFALFLESQFAAQGYADVEVRAEAYVTYNGRASRLLIDPTVDLTLYPRSLSAQPWILR